MHWFHSWTSWTEPLREKLLERWAWQADWNEVILVTQTRKCLKCGLVQTRNVRPE